VFASEEPEHARRDTMAQTNLSASEVAAAHLRVRRPIRRATDSPQSRKRASQAARVTQHQTEAALQLVLETPVAAARIEGITGNGDGSKIV
jgi:hypothetical protein